MLHHHHRHQVSTGGCSNIYGCVSGRGDRDIVVGARRTGLAASSSPSGQYRHQHTHSYPGALLSTPAPSSIIRSSLQTSSASTPSCSSYTPPSQRHEPALSTLASAVRRDRSQGLSVEHQPEVVWRGRGDYVSPRQHQQLSFSPMGAKASQSVSSRCNLVASPGGAGARYGQIISSPGRSKSASNSVSSTLNSGIGTSSSTFFQGGPTVKIIEPRTHSCKDPALGIVGISGSANTSRSQTPVTRDRGRQVSSIHAPAGAVPVEQRAASKRLASPQARNVPMPAGLSAKMNTQYRSCVLTTLRTPGEAPVPQTESVPSPPRAPPGAVKVVTLTDIPILEQERDHKYHGADAGVSTREDYSRLLQQRATVATSSSRTPVDTVPIASHTRYNWCAIPSAGSSSSASPSTLDLHGNGSLQRTSSDPQSTSSNNCALELSDSLFSSSSGGVPAAASASAVLGGAVVTPPSSVTTAHAVGRTDAAKDAVIGKCDIFEDRVASKPTARTRRSRTPEPPGFQHSGQENVCLSDVGHLNDENELPLGFGTDQATSTRTKGPLPTSRCVWGDGDNREYADPLAPTVKTMRSFWESKAQAATIERGSGGGGCVQSALPVLSQSREARLKRRLRRDMARQCKLQDQISERLRVFGGDRGGVGAGSDVHDDDAQSSGDSSGASQAYAGRQQCSGSGVDVTVAAKTTSKDPDFLQTFEETSRSLWKAQRETMRLLLRWVDRSAAQRSCSCMPVLSEPAGEPDAG